VVNEEPQVRQRPVRLADLRVRQAGVVGAVEDERVDRRQVVPTLVADGREERRGAAVLPGREQCGREEVAQPEVDERVVTGALDAVVEDADGLGRPIEVD
jgi:hypothetical protein